MGEGQIGGRGKDWWMLEWGAHRGFGLGERMRPWYGDIRIGVLLRRALIWGKGEPPGATGMEEEDGGRGHRAPGMWQRRKLGIHRIPSMSDGVREVAWSASNRGGWEGDTQGTYGDRAKWREARSP